MAVYQAGYNIAGAILKSYEYIFKDNSVQGNSTIHHSLFNETLLWFITNNATLIQASYPEELSSGQQ